MKVEQRYRVPDEEDLLRRVQATITRVNRKLAGEQILSSASLVDDLGFDSLRLIDLTIALEEEFDMDEFPMEEWYEEETSLQGHRFTVASLVAVCVRHVEAQR